MKIYYLIITATFALVLLGCENAQNSPNNQWMGKFIEAGGLAAENVKNPRSFHEARQRRENEELRQAYLKRINDPNHPLTQQDIELMQQMQNQQFQQQYLDHLREMERLKKQEIENQKRNTHIRPDGAGGYWIY